VPVQRSHTIHNFSDQPFRMLGGESTRIVRLLSRFRTFCVSPGINASP